MRQEALINIVLENEVLHKVLRVDEDWYFKPEYLEILKREGVVLSQKVFERISSSFSKTSTSIVIV